MNHIFDCSLQVTLFSTMVSFDDKAKVAMELCNDDQCKPISPGAPPVVSCGDFKGSKHIRLTARLWSAKGGDADNLAWQKAQLFRQKVREERIAHKKLNWVIINALFP